MKSTIETSQNETNIKNVFKIMRKWQYLKPLVLISIIRIVSLLNFWGTSYAFDVEGLGLGFNSIIAGFLEIISFYFLSNKIFYISNLYKSHTTKKRNCRILLYSFFVGFTIFVIFC